MGMCCACITPAKIAAIRRGAWQRRIALKKSCASMRSIPIQSRKSRRQSPDPGIPISAGFAPLASPTARILILGSLPGAESLRRQQYYAKAQNVFWRIMGELFGFAHDLPYADRIDALLAHEVALWDVCAAARRLGSLDAAIDRASVQTNDFGAFLARHPHITLICFNGAKAADLYRRRVRPFLDTDPGNIASLILPSTSPAHAARSYRDKKAAWDIVRAR
jgi:double-stranded uracil-DNA glycosylase